MEPEKMNSPGVSKLKLLVWLCVVALLVGAGYYAWWWGWPEYHAQRLDDDDMEVAGESELALLSLGERGRCKLYDFLLNKLNIELPRLKFESTREPGAQKIIAVSSTGEVKVAGAAGVCAEVLLLADNCAPVEKVCLPLAGLARAGTVKLLGAASCPDSAIGAQEITLVFLNQKQSVGYIVLVLEKDKARLLDVEVAGSEDIAVAMKGRSIQPVRIIAGPGVDYGRLLEFALYLKTSGWQPVLVFGDAESFGQPSIGELEELDRGLNAPDENQQRLAAEKLKTVMGEIFTYDTSRTPAQNRAAIENWSKWFEKNKPYIYFNAVAGGYSYDAAAAAAGVGHERYWLEKLRIVKDEPVNSNSGKEDQH